VGVHGGDRVLKKKKLLKQINIFFCNFYFIKIFNN
jgi:hypothetical protein